MTMHLVGPYMTTTNYKKKKQKPRTKAQQAQFEQEHRAYNKRMKQMHCHNLMMSLEDYDLYVRGLYKPPVRKQEKDFKPYAPTEPYVRNTTTYPSLKTSDVIPGGPTPKRESQQYTGDLIVGIGTMHKSNAVPIMRGTNEAKEIASMRR